MSLAKRCDRCGKYFEYKNKTVNGVALLKKSLLETTIAGEQYDLCDDCVKSFNEWIVACNQEGEGNGNEQ